LVARARDGEDVILFGAYGADFFEKVLDRPRFFIDADRLGFAAPRLNVLPACSAMPM
jgi:hypothetical protein